MGLPLLKHRTLGAGNIKGVQDASLILGRLQWAFSVKALS